MASDAPEEKAGQGTGKVLRVTGTEEAQDRGFQYCPPGHCPRWCQDRTKCTNIFDMRWPLCFCGKIWVLILLSISKLRKRPSAEACFSLSSDCSGTCSFCPISKKVLLGLSWLIPIWMSRQWCVEMLRPTLDQAACAKGRAHIREVTGIDMTNGMSNAISGQFTAMLLPSWMKRKPDCFQTGMNTELPQILRLMPSAHDRYSNLLVGLASGKNDEEMGRPGWLWVAFGKREKPSQGAFCRMTRKSSGRERISVPGWVAVVWRLWDESEPQKYAMQKTNQSTWKHHGSSTGNDPQCPLKRENGGSQVFLGTLKETK